MAKKIKRHGRQRLNNAWSINCCSGVSYNKFIYARSSANKSNKSKVLFDIFTESRSDKFSATRLKLGEMVRSGQPIVFSDFREYSLFLNRIGLLLEHGYVDIDEVYQMMGGSIIFAWNALGSAVLSMRKKENHSSYYQFHFEYLTAQALEYRDKGDEKIANSISESGEKIRVYSK